MSQLTKANCTVFDFCRDTFDIAWNGRTGIRQSRLSSSTSLLDKDGIFANSASSKLLERAHGILMRNKNFKSKPGLPKVSIMKNFFLLVPYTIIIFLLLMQTVFINNQR